jgi:hypothetical protein
MNEWEDAMIDDQCAALDSGEYPPDDAPAIDDEWAAYLDAISDPAAERIDDYLAGIDAAAEWTPIIDEPGEPLPLRAGLPKLHLAAQSCWEDAWRRGLVGDDEMAWYMLLINRHPYSWRSWLRSDFTWNRS